MVTGALCPVLGVWKAATGLLPTEQSLTAALALWNTDSTGQQKTARLPGEKVVNTPQEPSRAGLVSHC